MIDDLMAEVRRLLEAADFDSALRLSERCISLAQWTLRDIRWTQV